jgi:hypothetical protein
VKNREWYREMLQRSRRTDEARLRWDDSAIMMTERVRGGRMSGSGALVCERAGELAGRATNERGCWLGWSLSWIEIKYQARGDTVSRPRLPLFFLVFFK